jgi:hypothetical protein
MLRVLRRKPGRKVFCGMMSFLLLAAVVSPVRASVTSVQRALLEQRLLERFADDENDALLRALETALAKDPATLDELVSALLFELDDADIEEARTVLTQVLPGISVDALLSSVWLTDLRRFTQSDRPHSQRIAPSLAKSDAVVSSATSQHQAGSAPIRTALGTNLTRGQIRCLVTSPALGP